MALFNFQTQQADPFGSALDGYRQGRRMRFDEALKSAQITATFEKLKIARESNGLRAKLAGERMTLARETAKINQDLARTRLELARETSKSNIELARTRVDLARQSLDANRGTHQSNIALADARRRQIEAGLARNAADEPYRRDLQGIDLQQRRENARRTGIENDHLDEAKKAAVEGAKLGNAEKQKKLDAKPPDLAPKFPEGTFAPAAPTAPAAPPPAAPTTGKGRLQNMSSTGGEDPLALALEDDGPAFNVDSLFEDDVPFGDEVDA